MSLRRIFRTSDEDYKEKLQDMRQTVDGAELPSDVPVAPPIGHVAQPSMVETIRNMIRSEQLRLEAEAAGDESFEESDDFVIDDDPEPISAFEFERYFEPHAPENTVPKVDPASVSPPSEGTKPSGEGGSGEGGPQPKEGPPVAAPRSSS